MKPKSERYQNRIELLQGTRYAYPPDLAVGATARTRNQPIHGRALGALNLEFDIWDFSTLMDATNEKSQPCVRNWEVN